jgi:hypothetical protein
VLYLTVCSLDPTGKGRARWSNKWKAALNARFHAREVSVVVTWSTRCGPRAGLTVTRWLLATART